MLSLDTHQWNPISLSSHLPGGHHFVAAWSGNDFYLLITSPGRAPHASHFAFWQFGHTEADEVEFMTGVRFCFCFENLHMYFGGIVGLVSLLWHFGIDLEARRHQFLDFFNPWAQ